MSARDSYPLGVPCWVDSLHQDVDTAIHFYSSLFGWEFAGPGPMPEPAGEYHVARLRGRDVAGVGSRPPDYSGPPAWSTYVAVSSADDAATLAVRAGGSVLAEPFDALPAGRVAVLADPAGAAIGVWEPHDRQGAQLVNEHSAWAMSLLQTTDREAAKTFYGELFGWRAETIELDGAELTLWRLAGYVGGEPEQPVPRDMVGAMIALAPEADRAGVPPHWATDFWIADAEAAAARAPELGGRVVVEPHEQPPFRRSVLADPSGAVFSVSTLMH